jgi:hypothetical protein
MHMHNQCQQSNFQPIGPFFAKYRYFQISNGLAMIGGAAMPLKIIETSSSIHIVMVQSQYQAWPSCLLTTRSDSQTRYDRNNIT